MSIHRHTFARFLLPILLLLASAGAGAQDLSPGAGLLPVTQAFSLKVVVDKPGHVALHFAIAPHYYLYRSRIHATVQTAGIRAGAVELPPGEKEHDEYLGDVEIYHGSVDGGFAFTGAGAPPTSFKLTVDYQGCHEIAPKICYPPNSETFTLPTAGGGPLAVASGGYSGVAPSASGALAAALAATSKEQLPDLRGSGATTPALDTGLALALLLAFAGGLILNLMPCVLPILAVKAVGVLESNTSRSDARRHALAYAIGVLSSFVALGLAVLALRGAGQAIGWGTQLQQPVVVAVLACVLFVVGVWMSGVVAFGARLGNVGGALAGRGGIVGHFCTGVLAVVVASPCTGPFMGAALAYAFVAPPLHELLVMLALGVGLALPLVLIGFVPALARLLPKPGRWMVTLKQVLAFPMYLSAIWLVWVVANQRGADAAALVLIAMLLLAAAGWWHARATDARRLGHALTLVLLLASLLPLYGVATMPAPAHAGAQAESGVVKFSAVRLQQLRDAGTPVFVDIGADWCVTCKANEFAVLHTPAFRDLLKRTGTVYMQGDWTDVDPEIGAYLRQFHSPGVPLYVVYPRGPGAGRALPTLLTAAIVRNALEGRSP